MTPPGQIMWYFYIAQIVAICFGVAMLIRNRRGMHWLRFSINVVLAVIMGAFWTSVVVLVWAIEFVNKAP